MNNVFTRSWSITKLSFAVLFKDKKLLLFPILSVIFSILFVISLIFPTFILGMFNEISMNTGIAELVILFLLYLGLAFIATFFNVSTVYIIKQQFEGEKTSIKDSLKFSFSKIHLILAWSFVSAVVGVILRLLQVLARRARGPAAIVLHIFRNILSIGWSIATIFVVPVLVYKGTGPIESIKISSTTIKKTWGESLIRFFGLGLAEFIFILFGGIAFIGLGLLLSLFSPIGLIIGIILAVLYVLLTVLVFSIANTVYNTALFVYAESGKIPNGFNKNVLENAFVRSNDKNKF